MVVGAGVPVVACAGAGACLGVSACVDVGARLRAVVGLAVGRAVGAERRRERPRGSWPWSWRSRRRRLPARAPRRVLLRASAVVAVVAVCAACVVCCVCPSVAFGRSVLTVE